jgi:F0F1-type ATP synthase membrane subunit b/b'
MYITKQDLRNCGIQKTEEELDRFLKQLNNAVEKRIIGEYYDTDYDGHIDRHIEDIPNYKERIEKEAAELLSGLREQVAKSAIWGAKAMMKSYKSSRISD